MKILITLTALAEIKPNEYKQIYRTVEVKTPDDKHDWKVYK